MDTRRRNAKRPPQKPPVAARVSVTGGQEARETRGRPEGVDGAREERERAALSGRRVGPSAQTSVSAEVRKGGADKFVGCPAGERNRGAPTSDRSSRRIRGRIAAAG